VLEDGGPTIQVRRARLLRRCAEPFPATVLETDAGGQTLRNESDFYIEVDDPAAYLKRAEQLGGTVILPPTEIPQFHLTFALFSEGHVIGLLKGAI
jgi:predicted enzyme related to lactoylglutathione lyase